MMFQRIGFRGIFVTVLFSVIAQDGLLFAQVGGPDSTAGKLNRDSFLLCREIRKNLCGIRGQRTLFSKAYEIHEMADKMHRMVMLNAPVRGMDQALSDLSLLVDDLNFTIKAMRLPVFRDPVTIPTGPNGYVFYGGNGYPQPSFQCNGFPYRMIPERNMRDVGRLLSEIQSSIVQLHAHYSPHQHQTPRQRLFPAPGTIPQSDTDFKMQPSRLRKLFQEENDSQWKPSRKSAPLMPPVPPRDQAKPLQYGPQLLPPLPPND
ncbi:MAG: hypothetical protein P1V19_05255 [Gimesia sp.]|nr:hypothetical protein [Gimesia sp.]